MRMLFCACTSLFPDCALDEQSRPVGAKFTSAIGDAAAFDGNGARGHCKRKNWAPLVVALWFWQQAKGG